MQYKVQWKDLTEKQQLRAVENYQAIREIEEGKPFDFELAKELTTECNGFWLDTNDHDYLEVDI